MSIELASQLVLKKKLQQLSIALLDDDWGITEKAYDLLCDLWDDLDVTDLKEKIEYQDGRVFIDER